MASIDTARTSSSDSTTVRSRTGWIAAGSLFGALAASSCCILPLVLFGLGISGAWISHFTALAPYKPYFLAGTLGFLGYGYYLVHIRAKRGCTDGSCVRQLPSRLVRSTLWIATLLAIAAFSFDYVAPLLLN